MIIVSDLDGVVIEPGGYITQYLAARTAPDWGGYFEHTLDFAPIPAMITLIECLVERGDEVHLVTGRPESNRILTTRWLQENTRLKSVQCPVSLHMRPNGCYLKGAEYKLGVCKEIEPDLIFDDELDTVELLKAYGYTVLHVHGHRTETTRSDRVPQ